MWVRVGADARMCTGTCASGAWVCRRQLHDISVDSVKSQTKTAYRAEGGGGGDGDGGKWLSPVHLLSPLVQFATVDPV